MFRSLQSSILQTVVRRCSTNAAYKYEHIAVSTPSPHVIHAELNRPEKLNSLSTALWREYASFFQQASEDKECRAVVLSGRGKMFCAGIDLSNLMELSTKISPDNDIARNCREMEAFIKNAQDATSAIEKCLKPVIVAVHNACIGAGTSIITGADIRYCTSDAWFQIKEVEVGIAPDVGALQRISKVIGNESLARELLLTARRFEADEAQRMGLVSRMFSSKELMVEGAIRTGAMIARHSPVAVQATKEAILYSRDHSVDEGLYFQRLRNVALLQSDDLKKSAMAVMQKSKAEFENY